MSYTLAYKLDNLGWTSVNDDDGDVFQYEVLINQVMVIIKRTLYQFNRSIEANICIC